MLTENIFFFFLSWDYSLQIPIFLPNFFKRALDRFSSVGILILLQMLTLKKKIKSQEKQNEPHPFNCLVQFKLNQQ